MNDGLASYLDEKILLGGTTQQFLHDSFTMESNGEKKVGRQFFCPVRVCLDVIVKICKILSMHLGIYWSMSYIHKVS